LISLKALFAIPARERLTGASRAALNIAIGLSKLGVEVHVVTTRPLSPEAALRRLEGEGAVLHVGRRSPRGPLYWLYLAFLALECMVKVKPHVVHPHTPKVASIILPPSLLVGSARVLTVEGDPIYESADLGFLRRALTKALWALSLKLAHVVIPCSMWLASVLKRRHPSLEGRLRPAFNPIDYCRFASARGEGVREKLGVRGLMVFTAARLDEVKGIDVLIEAAAKVLAEGLDAHFVVAGEGPLKPKLKSLASKLGIEGRVCFLGFRDDVEELMAACDVAALPSRYEPFGMPAAEAGACSKPVVASRVGGLREVVVDGETGLLVKPGDADELAEALRKLLTDPSLRAKMGSAGAARALKLFTPKAVAHKVLEAYLDAMKRAAE
jgi:glycosyltransferase involved in cell wall biosynthesis